MVVLRDGCAEDAQGAVALELVDEPAFGPHGADDGVEEPVEDLDHRVRILPLRESGRADDVDEHRGGFDLLPTAAEFALHREPRDVGADVAPEDITHPLPLAQTSNHRVEAGLDKTDLTGFVDVNVGIQPARLNERLRIAESP